MIDSYDWNSNENVSIHLVKLKSLWNKLNTGLRQQTKHLLPNLLLICKALYILPVKFKSFKSSYIMLMHKDEIRTVDELIMQLCMYERNFMQFSKKIEVEKLN